MADIFPLKFCHIKTGYVHNFYLFWPLLLLVPILKIFFAKLPSFSRYLIIKFSHHIRCLLLKYVKLTFFCFTFGRVKFSKSSISKTALSKFLTLIFVSLFAYFTCNSGNSITINNIRHMQSVMVLLSVFFTKFVFGLFHRSILDGHDTNLLNFRHKFKSLYLNYA